jgi:type VI protein secretion system component VasF
MLSHRTAEQMHASSPHGEHMTRRRYYLSFFDWFAGSLAVAAAVGIAVIIGWFLNIAVLKSARAAAYQPDLAPPAAGRLGHETSS